MVVSGTNVTAGSTITAISGNTVTLSANTGATAATNAQVTFAPPTTTATATTTTGSNTVTIAAASLPTNFVPTTGVTIGSSTNILGGTTVSNVSLASGTYTLTLSQPATATTATGALVFNALSNTYTGTTYNQGGSSVFGTLNLSGLAGSILIPGNLSMSNATVTENTNQGQIAASSNVSWIGGGTLTRGHQYSE